MKHISFDDSLVLGEFARIANEKGFIKDAVDTPVYTLMQAVQEASPSGPTKVVYDGLISELKQNINSDPVGLKEYLLNRYKDPKMQSLISKYLVAPAPPAPVVPRSPVRDLMETLKGLARRGGTESIPYRTLLKELSGYKHDVPAAELRKILMSRYGKNPSLKAVIESSLGKQAGTDTESLKKDAGPNEFTVETNRLLAVNADLLRKYDSDQSKVRPIYEAEVAKSVARFKRKYGEHPVIEKFRVNVLSAGVPVNASKDLSGLAKSADESLYDISGETGKQLIDSAHPGGGTKTELSHSKTDENLVETIIEQQERDIEVAKSVPKGTYAILVTLYNMLQKMGQKKHLGYLESAIKKVATSESVISHTLASLADQLDECGAKEAADKVDVMISTALSPTMVLPAAQLVGMHAIYKDLTNFEGTLDNLINRLGDLDPNENAKDVVDGWISTLSRGKQALKIMPTTTDPTQRAGLLGQKQKQVSGLANYIDQMVVQWPQVKANLTDWGFDAQQAANTLMATQDSVRNQVTQLTQKLQGAQQKEFDFAGVGVSPKEQTELVERTKKKEWDPLNDLRHAKILRKRFNRAIRDLDEHHSDAIPRFRDEDIGRFPGRLKEELGRAISMVRDAGGWSKFEKNMDDKRSIAGKGPAKSVEEPKPEGRPDLMKVEQVRNRIVDKIMERLGLRPEQINIESLYRVALNTAKRNLEKRNLTSDEDGQRRLETFLSDIVNHPKFADRMKKYIK